MYTNKSYSQFSDTFSLFCFSNIVSSIIYSMYTHQSRIVYIKLIHCSVHTIYYSIWRTVCGHLGTNHNPSINIMLHYPLSGLCRRKYEAFDFDLSSKTFPIREELDRSPYTCKEVWPLTSKHPCKSQSFRWGEGRDLTDWHAQ